MLDKSIAKYDKILVKSSDKFLSEMFIGEIKDMLPDMKMDICYDVDTFVEKINRGGLFGTEKRIIVLWDLTDEAVQQLSPYLGYAIEDKLILIENKTLKRLKAYQNIKASFEYAKLNKPDIRGCRGWLAGYMSKQGLKVSGDVIGTLIERKGIDLSALANEVQKLKLLYGEKEITVSDCCRVVGNTSEVNMFEFVDNFVHKRTKKCIEDIGKINPNEYVKVIHFLQNYVEKLYTIAIHRSRKRSAQDISELVGIPKFYVTTKYFSALSVYPKVNLLKLMDLLNELDKNIRIVRYNRHTIMEFYMLKASSI